MTSQQERGHLAECPLSSDGVLLTLAEGAAGLLWQSWEDAYIVFQPSSTETHVFNNTTALILESLEEGPLSMETLKGRLEIVLDVEKGSLATGNFDFAVSRLETLGLIDRLAEAVSAP